MTSPHFVRFVQAIALGAASLRGCPFATETACECPWPTDAATDGTIYAFSSSGTCTAIDIDAGCRSETVPAPGGPLLPPDLSA